MMWVLLPCGHAKDIARARPADLSSTRFLASSGEVAAVAASSSTMACRSRKILACTRPGGRGLRIGSRRSPRATDRRSSGSTTDSRRRVFALALRILGIRADAEDVVQEVFLQMWRRRDVSPRPRQPGVLDHDHRPQPGTGQNPRGEYHEEEASSISANDPGRPSSSPCPGRSSGRSRPSPCGSALARLPEEQRRVLELAYFEGLTQTEIAARLGEPLGTVKTRIRLGMERLKRLVGEGETPERLP